MTVKDADWPKKKPRVLKHVVELMNEKNNKNVVILHDKINKSKEIESELKKITKKTIVTYPSPKNKQHGRSNLQTFIENDNQILVTRDKYFNGSEASNVIYITTRGSSLSIRGITGSIGGILKEQFVGNMKSGTRSSFMRAVEHLVIVNVIKGSADQAIFNGLKEDNRFL